MKEKQILLFKILKENDRFKDEFKELYNKPNQKNDSKALLRRIFNQVNGLINEKSLTGRNCDVFKREVKEFGPVTLMRFFRKYLEEGKVVDGRAKKLLARYVMIETYEKDGKKVKDNFDDFLQYARNMQLDLFCSNPNILDIDLWKLSEHDTRTWYMYISHHGTIYRLPLIFRYHHFESLIDVKVKGISNVLIEGSAESHYATKPKIPEGEFWVDAINEELGIVLQLRLYIGKTTLDGDKLISGLSTYNVKRRKNGKIAMHASPVLLTPANYDYEKFNSQTIKRFDKLKSDELQGLFSSISAQDQLKLFFENSPDSFIPNLTSNDVEGLQAANRPPSKKGKNLSEPLDSENYHWMKKRLDGTWFGLNRISDESDELGLVKYDFKFQDLRQSIEVRRKNYNSSFTGGADRRGFNVYFVMSGDTKHRRSLITFELKQKNYKKPLVYQAIGMFNHDGATPLAWRELLIFFPKGKEDQIPKIFNGFSEGNITHSEFLEIDKRLISRDNKLYIANRDQGILTYPISNKDLTKQYQRQMEAKAYCNKHYVVYVPYSYNDTFDLFRLILYIDDLSQVTLTLKYPDSKKVVYKGHVYKVLNTLRISVFSDSNQYIQILCNVVKNIESINPILDGIILGVDRQSEAISSRCFMIASSLFEKEKTIPQTMNEAGVLTKSSDEYANLFEIISTYFDSRSFKTSSNLDDYFDKSRIIRHYTY